MNIYKISRSKDLSLEFEGELLASGDCSVTGGVERNRWHVIALYRTVGGQYVAHIGYRTQWTGEQAWDVARVMATPEEVADWLRTWIPASVIIGYPVGAYFAEKQARMLATVERDYATLVSEVLEAAGPEFVERIK